MFSIQLYVSYSFFKKYICSLQNFRSNWDIQITFLLLDREFCFRVLFEVEIRLSDVWLSEILNYMDILKKISNFEYLIFFCCNKKNFLNRKIYFLLHSCIRIYKLIGFIISICLFFWISSVTLENLLKSKKIIFLMKI